MESIAHYYFNVSVMAEAVPGLMKGLVLTLALSAATIAFGLPLGLGLAMLRTTRRRVLTIPIVIFADVFRALPPLVILIFFYFALPYAGFSMSPFLCVVLTLGLCLAALAEEIFWSGIIAVNRGQWEAAYSTGISFLPALVLVVVPQGIRLVIPPLTNKVISVTKMTSLASVVAVPELLNQAVTEQGFHANPSPLTLAALMFLLVFLPLVQLSNHLERRYGTIG